MIDLRQAKTLWSGAGIAKFSSDGTEAVATITKHSGMDAVYLFDAPKKEVESEFFVDIPESLDGKTDQLKLWGFDWRLEGFKSGVKPSKGGYGVVALSRKPAKNGHVWIESYVYHKDRSGNYGEHTELVEVPLGQRMTVGMRFKREAGNSKNGVLGVTINGQNFERDNYRFGADCRGVRTVVYHGGGKPVSKPLSIRLGGLTLGKKMPAKPFDNKIAKPPVLNNPLRITEPGHLAPYLVKDAKATNSSMLPDRDRYIINEPHRDIYLNGKKLGRLVDDIEVICDQLHTVGIDVKIQDKTGPQPTQGKAGTAPRTSSSAAFYAATKGSWCIEGSIIDCNGHNIDCLNNNVRSPDDLRTNYGRENKVITLMNSVFKGWVGISNEEHGDQLHADLMHPGGHPIFGTTLFALYKELIMENVVVLAAYQGITTRGNAYPLRGPKFDHIAHLRRENGKTRLRRVAIYADSRFQDIPSAVGLLSYFSVEEKIECEEVYWAAYDSKTGYGSKNWRVAFELTGPAYEDPNRENGARYYVPENVPMHPAFDGQVKGVFYDPEMEHLHFAPEDKIGLSYGGLAVSPVDPPTPPIDTPVVDGPPIETPTPPVPVFNGVELNSGASRYVVYTEGLEVSRHSAEREASESAVNQVLAGKVDVYYEHEYRVTVTPE